MLTTDQKIELVGMCELNGYNRGFLLMPDSVVVLYRKFCGDSRIRRIDVVDSIREFIKEIF